MAIRPWTLAGGAAYTKDAKFPSLGTYGESEDITGGMGLEGVIELQKFVEAGGVLITLGGTWCPNCHDEAAFLMPFYEQHRERGFEVIALMFERHGEYDKAAKAVRNYRSDLGVTFTTLIAGVSETEEASKALPTLSGIYGYPTTIFVDRRGVVRDIHVGFTGPATGAHYDEYVAEFGEFVDKLLDEPAT